MRERTIVLPTRDNNGLSLARQVGAIKREILDIAGGYSEVRQAGVWREGGRTYRNVSVRIVTTVDERADERIVARLPVWCLRLRQVCLYTHAIAVEAAFVYPMAQAS